MKILILSRGRTRSSYLQDKLSQTYQIDNYLEKLNTNGYAYSDTLNFKYRHVTGNVENLRWNHFCKLSREVTDNLFKNENFVVKLWPRMLVSFPQQVVGKLEDYKPKIITDLTTNYRIKEYDTIYFLDRDITDSVCSWIYARIIKQFLFKNINDSKIDRRIQQLEPVVIPDNYLPTINYYIYEIALQHKILDYLYENQINFIKLDYNDIPDYCNSTLKGVDMFKHYNFDYNSVIVNYNEIRDHSLNAYEIAKSLVSNIKFT